MWDLDWNQPVLNLSTQETDQDQQQQQQNQLQPQFSPSQYSAGEQHQQHQGLAAGMNCPYSAHFGKFLTNSAPPPHSHLHFSNNTYFPPSYNAAHKSMKISEVGDWGTVSKRSGNDQNQQSGTAKRPRNETPSPSPSPLPAFKVRKEKVGDRISALQQLVSPFGKTDTASVLSEAIEYIKFLHEQVSVLSTPYLKCGALVQQQHQQRKVFSFQDSIFFFF